jgi:carbamate kinase
MTKLKKPLVVVAIGGNSLILDKEHQFVEDQYKAICETVGHIVELVKMNYNVVITHGNGPQVGFIMRRSEIAEEVEHMHPVPLVSCDADTQGAIGYQIQQAMHNELVRQGVNKQAVTIITQVEVDELDHAFQNPSKPIGTFYNDDQLNSIKRQHPDWDLIEDANRGYRRVVPSPRPKRIVEIDAIQALLDCGHIVIAAGGGGIPVVKDREGYLKGMNAVIDKDHASSLLAKELKADFFVISTAVDYVYTNFSLPNEELIKKMTVSRAKELMMANQFGNGSMLPKVEACVNFVEATGNDAIITSPKKLGEAIQGFSGTRITRH